MARIVQTSNSLTQPEWAGDYLSRDHLIPGGAKVDAAQFRDTDAVVATTTGVVAIGATAIPVTALSGPIPAGTVLYFGEAGELARLSAAAATGATSLAVDAIPAQIESGDSATYAGAGTGLKTIVSGTALGRTFAERDAGTAFGPAAAADDEVRLLAFDIVDADINNDAVLYRPGSIVKENFLPNFATLAAGVITKIRAEYVTTKGAN